MPKIGQYRQSTQLTMESTRSLLSDFHWLIESTYNIEVGKKIISIQNACTHVHDLAKD